MTIAFDRPVGSPADVKELEYLSALHQSEMPNLRQDASIHANDMGNLLVSRHGLLVTDDDDDNDDSALISSRILGQLVGDFSTSNHDSQSLLDDEHNNNHNDYNNDNNNNNASRVMDLVQVVALLLVPHLIQEGKDGRALQQVFAVLGDLLSSSSSSSSSDKEHDDNDSHDCNLSTRALLLDRNLLRDALAWLGEVNVDDKVLDEMVAAVGDAGGDGDGDCCNGADYQNHRHVQKQRAPASTTKTVWLTPESLYEALTADVQLYKPEWTDRLSTHYQDVFGDPDNDDGDDTRSTNYDLSNAARGDDVDDEALPLPATTCPRPSDDMQREHHPHPPVPQESLLDMMKYRFRRRKQPTGVTNITAVDSHQRHSLSSMSSSLPSTPQPPTPSTTPRPTIRKLVTGSAIDSTADTYKSQTYAVLLWASMIFVYLSYFYRFASSWGQVECANVSLSDFACQLVNGITSWLVILVELSFLGLAYISLGSAGNALSYKNKRVTVVCYMVGIVTILFATILSLVFEVDTPIFDTQKQNGFFGAYLCTALIGSILIVMQVIALAGQVLPPNRCHCPWKWFDKCWNHMLTPGIEQMERRTKRAARYKVSLLVENALAYHRQPTVGTAVGADNSNNVTVDSAKSALRGSSEHMTLGGSALLNFQMREERVVRTGGIVWAWKRVWNGTIFEEEGIWLHSRLVSSTATQFFICVFLVAFFAIVGLKAVRTYTNDEEKQNDQTTEPEVYTWEAVVAGAAGVVFGILACFAIALVYVPSFISSCLKYRSGVLPSLRDRDFVQYRCALDLVTQLYGAAFWGSIFTGIIAAFLIGGVVFLAVWHQTRTVVLAIIAQLIGIGITLGLKQIVLLLLRRQFFAAFYRKMPLKDNVMNVMLECWYVAVTSGIMLLRTARLLLITACYLGRLDTPLLADGVGIVGPIALDHYPMSFRRDLLQHDAHRHPYIERLATMYMMKLRYGNDFGTRAGSCWRLLFVLCLMPWMRKYRLRAFEYLERLDMEIEIAETELEDEADDRSDHATQPTPPERMLRRQSTQRKLDSLKNLKAIQKRPTANREELLEQENTLLRERILQLLKQNKRMRRLSTYSGDANGIGSFNLSHVDDIVVDPGSVYGSFTRSSRLARIPSEDEDNELSFFDANEDELET